MELAKVTSVALLECIVMSSGNKQLFLVDLWGRVYEAAGRDEWNLFVIGMISYQITRAWGHGYQITRAWGHGNMGTRLPVPFAIIYPVVGHATIVDKLCRSYKIR